MANTLTIDEFRDRLRTLGRGEFRRRLRVVLVAAALELEDQARRNASGSSPNVRTGRLRNSIRAWAPRDGPLQLRAQAGGRDEQGEVRYAQIQEYGGTVRARGRGKLRIPLEPALTGKGVDRFSGPIRRLAPEGMFAAFPDSKGRLFLWRVDQEGPPVPWYRLVQEITVPRTLFLGGAFELVQAELDERLGGVFRLAMESTHTPEGA